MSDHSVALDLLDQPSGLDVAAAVTRLVFEVLDGVVEGRGAVYVSTPITTGRRFVEWRRGPGAALAPSQDHYWREHDRQVVQRNREQAKPVVRAVRERGWGVVIDPTTVHDVPGWEQPDYHAFWARVIERYAGTVVFADGWEYSSGGAWEFLVAVRTGARLLRQDLEPLTVAEGARLINDAIVSLGADGVLPTEPLREALRELHRTAGVGGSDGHA
jgi:hypothetical protein